MTAADATILTVALAAASVWDIRVRRIPNPLVIAAAVLLVAADLEGLSFMTTAIRAGSAAVLLGLWLLVPTGMGAGDAKLLAVCALGGGPFLALVLFFGSAVTMALFALARWVATWGRVRLGGALPMAPFAGVVWVVVLTGLVGVPHRF
jgi:Flp pilus assembly protein protease CpaA